jgi:ankyrin repeat protein
LDTPLHAAFSGGYADVIKLLLARGANPNATDKVMLTVRLRRHTWHPDKVLFGTQLKQTPLSLARARGYSDIVTMLESGDVNLHTDSPLALADLKVDSIRA